MNYTAIVGASFGTWPPAFASYTAERRTTTSVARQGNRRAGVQEPPYSRTRAIFPRVHSPATRICTPFSMVPERFGARLGPKMRSVSPR